MFVTDVDAGERERAAQMFQLAKQRLAEAFDADRELVRHETDEGVFHSPRDTLGYARCLLLDGGEAEWALAARMVEGILDTQERQPGNAHEGNWFWMVDDGHVSDLNAVEFVLEQLCHLLLESAPRLPADTVGRMHAAMRLGLAEVARLDVDVSYTNIALLDIHNSILAGQLLGQPGWSERGARKLARWAALTAADGGPREYNSPTYAGVDLDALAAIAEHAADPSVALQARLWEERLWLHVATRYHAPSAQLAGPHSRAYHNDVTGGTGRLKLVFHRVVGDERLTRVSPFHGLDQERAGPLLAAALGAYHVPEPVRRLLTDKPWPYTVRETVDAAGGIDLSTHLTADWALGVASRSHPGLPGAGQQANNLVLHYRSEDEPGYGVLYTRLTINDKRIGSFYHPSGRSRGRLLLDEGAFRGLGHGDKAIGVYGLMPQTEQPHSIRVDVHVTGLGERGAAAVLVGGGPVDGLPAELPPGATAVVVTGPVLVGLRPLRHSNLGRAAPVLVERRDRDLVLSQVLYDGPAKRFWEYSSLSGPFFRGNVEAGWVVEVGDVSAFGDAAAFAAHMAAARLDDVTVDRVRTVRYASGGQELLLRYRLDDLTVLERRVNQAAQEPVALRAPDALQDGDGRLRLRGATLAAGAGSWLYTDPDGRTFTATRALADEAGPWRLSLPGARQVELDGARLARLVCVPGELSVEAEPAPRLLRLHGWAERPRVTVGGVDRSPRLRQAGADAWQLTWP